MNMPNTISGILRQASLALLRERGVERPEDPTILMACLGNENPRIREEAARALGTVQTSLADTATALPALLEDNEWRVRWAASASLARLSSAGADVTGAVIDCIEKGYPPALILALSYAQAADPTIITALLPYLPDRRLQVAGATKAALVRLISSAPAYADTIIQQLDHTDANVRWHAAHVLTELTNHGLDVTGPLLHILRDDKSEARIAVAAALGSLHEPATDVIEALFACLHDADEEMRRWALYSLMDLADRKAGRPTYCKAPVCGLTTSPCESQGSKDLGHRIISYLQDPDPVVRRQVAWQIKELHSARRDVAAALCIDLQDEDAEVRHACAEHLHSEAFEHVANLDMALAGLQNADSQVRRDMAWAILGTGEVTEPAIAALLNLMHDEDADVREAAIGVLSALRPGDRSLAAMAQERLRDAAGGTRQAALWLLAHLEIPDPALVHAVLDCFDDPESKVREAALGALSRLAAEHPQVAAQLQHEDRERLLALLHDDSRSVRISALWSINKHLMPEPRTQAVATLCEQAEDEDEDMRWSAVRALGRVGETSERVTEALMARLHDADSFVRLAAIGALESLGDTRTAVITSLRDCLTDESVQHRQAAAAALATLGVRDQAVASALLAYPDPEEPYSIEREHTIELLGQMARDDPSLVDAWLDRPPEHIVPVQEAEITALTELAAAQPDLVTTLRRHVTERDGRSRLRAARVLARLGIRDVDVKAVFLDELRFSGDTSVPAILHELGTSDTEVAAALLDWLAFYSWYLHVPWEPASEVGMQVIDAVLGRLYNQGETYVREEALSILVRLGANAQQLAQALCICLQTSPNSGGEMAVEQPQSETPLERAVLPVLHSQVHHWDPRVRETVTAILNRWS